MKAFETSKDKHVILTDEDFAAVKAEGVKTIDISDFVPYDEIDPIYFDRTYFLGPQDGAEKVYALMREAMEQTGLAAIGKYVMRERQYLGCLRVRDGVIALEKMFFHDEIRPSDELAPGKRKVPKEELELATALIERFTGSFKPEKYEDTYRKALLAVVRAKQKGKTITAAEPEADEEPTDLLAALKASVEAAKKGRGSVRAKRPPARKKPAARRKKPRSASRRPSSSPAERGGVGDQVAVPGEARLRDPPQRRVVDVDDPEPLPVAMRPLEVVEQRPDEVARDRDAVGDCALDRVDVPGEERLPLGVVDHAVVAQRVAERSAVLGHVDRGRRVLVVHADEQVVEAVRRDLPAHLGVHRVRLVDHLPAAVGRRGNDLAAVVVDAQEVDRRRDHVEVAVADRGSVGSEGGEDVLRIGALEDRVEEPPVLLPVGRARRRGVGFRRLRPDRPG